MDLSKLTNNLYEIVSDEIKMYLFTNTIQLPSDVQTVLSVIQGSKMSEYECRNFIHIILENLEKNDLSDLADACEKILNYDDSDVETIQSSSPECVRFSIVDDDWPELQTNKPKYVLYDSDEDE